MTDILKIVMKLAEDVTLFPEKEVKENSTLDDIGMDSLDQVEFIMALEEEFKIKILDSDADKIHSIKDAVNYLESKLK